MDGQKISLVREKDGSFFISLIYKLLNISTSTLLAVFVVFTRNTIRVIACCVALTQFCVIMVSFTSCTFNIKLSAFYHKY